MIVVENHPCCIRGVAGVMVAGSLGRRGGCCRSSALTLTGSASAPDSTSRRGVMLRRRSTAPNDRTHHEELAVPVGAESPHGCRRSAPPSLPTESTLAGTGSTAVDGDGGRDDADATRRFRLPTPRDTEVLIDTHEDSLDLRDQVADAASGCDSDETVRAAVDADQVLSSSTLNASISAGVARDRQASRRASGGP